MRILGLSFHDAMRAITGRKRIHGANVHGRRRITTPAPWPTGPGRKSGSLRSQSGQARCRTLALRRQVERANVPGQ